MKTRRILGITLALAMSLPTSAFAAHTHNWYDDIHRSVDGVNAYYCECGARRYEDVASIRDYVITLDANGGGVDTQTLITKDGRIKLPIPFQSSDYQFEGWYTEKDGGIEVTPDYVYEDDTTLYAHWSIVGTRTLFFASDGGSDMRIVTQPYGTVLNVEGYIPVKSGYVFDGWYSDPRTKEQKVTEVSFNEDTVLYAKWHSDGSAPMLMSEQSVLSAQTSVIYTITTPEGAEIDVPVTARWLELHKRLQYLMQKYHAE